MLSRLSRRCYVLPSAATADRPSLGAVCGDRLTLRIDCGNSPAHDALMREAMRTAGLPPAALTAVTHSHWDHTFGMCAADHPVIACSRTQAQLQRMTAWRWTPEAMQKRLETREDIPFCHQEMLVEYPDPARIRVRTADIVVSGDTDVDLGGVTVSLLLLPSSHTDDCMAMLVREEGVLYLGDITYEDLHHDPECLHTRRYRQLMDALAALDFTIAVPGHQEPMSKQELLSDMADMLTCGEALLLDD